MKKSTALILIGASALWYFVLRGVNAIQFAFKRIYLVSFTDTTIDLRLDMLIKNPLLIGAVVNNIAGDIYLDNIQVATVNYPLNQRIAARAVSPVTLFFTASLQQLGQALFNNIQTGSIQTLTVRFVGTITVQGVNLPIDRFFTFNELIKQA